MAGITAATTGGTTTTLSDEHVDALASTLRGTLIRAGEADYDEARRIWNGMIDRGPALIIRCRGAEDVAAAVGFARRHELLVSVRGGGHGVAGLALADGGLTIDLSEMNDVVVDAEARTARVRGGCRLGDVDRATERHGLATPLGVVTRTGVAGLTLSGGIGWLRRAYGLSCDNLLSAEVVTADGSALRASADRHEDLFWAIRGGGGNFGIVTEFEFRLHPVGPDVAFCFVLYPAERSREVLRAGERYLAEGRDEVAPLGVLGLVPELEEFPPEAHGAPYVALLALHPGDPRQGEEILRPLRQLGEPIGDLSGTIPYTEAQAVLDEDYPDGWRYYWKSVNLPELSDETIDCLAERAAAAPSRHSTIDVWYQGGAIAHVGEQETAFGNRSQPYLIGIEANWEDEATSDANVAWVRETFADLRAFSTGGVYLNFPGFLEEGDDLLREGVGANYDRLVEVKTRYDPTNFFRLNANIPPRSQA